MPASKKKIYQFKPILAAYEAVDYLSELINSPLNGKDFIDLGDAHGLRAYIEPSDLDFLGRDTKTGKEITVVGYQEVVEGLGIAHSWTQDEFGKPNRYHLYLPLAVDIVLFRGQNDEGETVEWRLPGKPEFDEESLLFKPADIQAFADKLNGKPPVEVQRDELAALRERVQELQKENAKLQVNGAVAGGLTFPYSTPELEAMQQAANHYWAGRSEELRKPTQTEIATAITEALGAELTAEKRPPRKASQYATAIQPEQYREP